MSRPAKSSRWSARTAQARRRCCGRSPAFSRSPAARSVSRASASTVSPPHQRVELRHHAVAGGPAGVRAADRRGQPAARRLSAARQGNRAGPRSHLRACFRFSPKSAATSGRRIVGRAAADARHRPCADGTVPSCCCWTNRRWACRRFSSIRSWMRLFLLKGRHHGSSRRAERQRGSRDRGPRLCIGNRKGRL